MRTTRNTLTYLALAMTGLALFLVAPTATATSTTTAAPAVAVNQKANLPVTDRRKCRPKRCFGALAVNPRSGAAGYKTDAKTRKGAIRQAMKKCRKNSSHSKGQCRRAGWVRNGCIAAAYRARNGRIVEWKSRYAYMQRPAVRKAKKAVRGPGTVKMWAWACTTRRR